MEKNIDSLGFCWAQGSPVVLEQGALVSAEQGMCAARLRLQNHWNKELRELDILVLCEDAAGRALELVPYSYTGLSVPMGQVFGEDPIPLPDPRTARIQVRVKSARFADGPWEASPPVRLREVPLPGALETLGSGAQQFEREFGARAVAGIAATNVPVRGKGYWWCACGEFHEAFEQGCAVCGLSLEWQLDACRKEVLMAHSLAHEEQQARSGREAEAEAAQAKRRLGRRIKLAAGLLVAVALLVSLGAGAGYLIPREKTYRRAQEAFLQQNYVEAFAAYHSLDGYRDSSALLRQPEFSLLWQLQGAWTQQACSHWQEETGGPGPEEPMLFSPRTYVVKGTGIQDAYGRPAATVSQLRQSEAPGYYLLQLDGMLDETYYLRVFPDKSVGIWRTGILPYDSDGVYRVEQVQTEGE